MFKKVKSVLVLQLTQGVSAERLALSCALAFVLATFPVIGATTVIVFVAAILLKLNQPIMQALNYSLTPVHLILLPVFLRVGEKILGVTAVSLNLKEMHHLLQTDWRQFLSDYGTAGLHAILGWFLIAPLTGLVLYFILRPVFVHIAQRGLKRS